MEFKCKSCQAPLLKSYGNTYKLRARHVRWENLHDKAAAQCRFCRAFNELPIKLKVVDSGMVFEVSDVKKSEPKEKLIITDKLKKKK